MRTVVGNVSFIIHHVSREHCLALQPIFGEPREVSGALIWTTPLWLRRMIEAAYTAAELQQLRQQAQRRDV